MKAERQASGQREWIVSLEDSPQLPRPDSSRANNAGVHVELVGFKSKPMKQAEVVVYYLPPGIHSLLVDQASDTSTPSDLKKTFVLSAAGGEPNAQLAGSLLIGNAASVTRVRLLSVEYTDGSTWQTTRASNCSVEPGLMMAVAGR